MTDIVWIVSSCALILAVIVIRAIFGKRMSAGLRYALWGLVLLRLLIPGTVFSSPVSVETAAKKTEVLQDLEAVKGYSAIARTDTGAVIGRPSASAPKAPSKPQTGEQTPPETRVILNEAAPERFVRMQKTLEARDILNIVLYTGMGIAAAYFIAANVIFYFRLRAKRKKLNVDIGCPVYEVEGLTSSCLFLNSIYISSETAEDDEALRFVLAHERAHRRHGDGVWAILRSAAIVLHWYNPLVWVAAFLSRRDSELFADAGAIAALGDEERENYGRTLIELSSGAKVYAPIACSATMMTSGKKTLKARVKGIANRKRMGAIIAAAVLILAAAACLCTFCGAEKQEEGSEPQNTAAPVDTDEPTAAPTVEATEITDVFPEKYDEYEMAKLVSFFHTADENGVRNGTKLFKNYDPTDPASWQSGDPLTAPEMVWNEDGRLVSLSLRGMNDFPNEDTLAGRLDLTGFAELVSVSLSGAVRFDELTIRDCPKLNYINNEWAASGTVDVRTDNLFYKVWLGSFTQLLFSGRIEEGGEVKRLNLIPEGSGHVEVMFDKAIFADAPADERRLMIAAIPDEGYRLTGWFDEMSELYSSENYLDITETQPPLGDEFVLQASFARKENLMPMYEGEAPKASGMIAVIPDEAPYTPYACDLDLDGLEDTVRLERIPPAEGFDIESRRITITLGSNPNESYTDEITEVFSCAVYVLDCDTQDGRLDLIFFNNTEEWFTQLVGYRVAPEGGSINKYWPGRPVAVEGRSPDKTDPTWEFDAENGIPVSVYTSVLGDRYLPTRITLTNEGFKMLEPMSYDEDSDGNSWMELKRDISVTPCDPGHDAEAILCKAGTKLLPYRTDGRYWIEFKLESGAAVRKEIEVRGNTVLIDGLDQRKFFDLRFGE